MLNPTIAEMAARDRHAEMHRAAAKRPYGLRGRPATERRAAPAARRSLLRARRSNPQRAVGWFLVSLGLRLALPRSRAGAPR
jgi:hypothetical protein